MKGKMQPKLHKQVFTYNCMCPCNGHMLMLQLHLCYYSTRCTQDDVYILQNICAADIWLLPDFCTHLNIATWKEGRRKGGREGRREGGMEQDTNWILDTLMPAGFKF